MKKNKASLWTPNEEIVKKSNLEFFCKNLHKKRLLKYNQNFKNIWEWSVKNPEIFWEEIWDFTKIKGLKGRKIIKKNKIFYKNIFFPDSKLNYAENLLPKKNEDIALNFLSENGVEKKNNMEKIVRKRMQIFLFFKKYKFKKK